MDPPPHDRVGDVPRPYGRAGRRDIIFLCCASFSAGGRRGQPLVSIPPIDAEKDPHAGMNALAKHSEGCKMSFVGGRR